MRYTYKCPDCGGYSLNVPVDERDAQTCCCGSPLTRQVAADIRSASIAIPIYMQAGHDDLFPPNGLEPQTPAERKIQEDCGACSPSKGWN